MMEKVVCFDLWNEMYKELLQLMSMDVMDDIRFFTQDGLVYHGKTKKGLVRELRR